MQLTYNWLDYEKEFQGIPLKSQRKSSNLKQPSISLSDPTPQDFLRGRLPKLKRNAPMFLLVSHRVPGVPQWVPLTAEWVPIDLRVSAGPMLVSKLRSPICVHRCPPVAAIGVHGVPPASAVARHCGVVTSIRRNIHIFGVHCFTLAHSVEPIWCPLAAWCCTISPLHHCWDAGAYHMEIFCEIRHCSICFRLSIGQQLNGESGNGFQFFEEFEKSWKERRSIVMF